MWRLGQYITLACSSWFGLLVIIDLPEDGCLSSVMLVMTECPEANPIVRLCVQTSPPFIPHQRVCAVPSESLLGPVAVAAGRRKQKGMSALESLHSLGTS